MLLIQLLFDTVLQSIKLYVIRTLNKCLLRLAFKGGETFSSLLIYNSTLRLTAMTPLGGLRV